METNGKGKRSSLSFVTLGYLSIIILGSILLCLPIASKSGTWTSYVDCLFTATSATCVTGLVPFDTYTHWTLFGQIVILAMIQLGGIGFMSLITMLTKSLGLRVRFSDRKFLMESVGARDKSGIKKIVTNITFGSLVVEIIGALLLAIRFIPKFGVGTGLYYSIFHSVSAFCNAGFDLMGIIAPGSSLMYFANDWLVCIVIAALIFIGGIGFIVWNDIVTSKFKFEDMQLHTQITVVGSLVLIFTSTILFYIFERGNLFVNLSVGNGVLEAFFQAVTTRTAGFFTMDVTNMSDASILLTMFLMFVGGSSGSTAGGIKVTTLVIVMLGVMSLSRSNGDILLRGKKIGRSSLHQALAIFATYLITIGVISLAICAIENMTLTEIVFETVSAMGTVGLTLGITESLSVASKLLLVILMYVGRVGILTIIFSFMKRQKEPTVIIPEENVMVG